MRYYQTESGERVPSVTTVLNNLGWKTQGLVKWAWEMGMQGIDYNEARDAAAQAGTIAHAMVEGDIKGEDWRNLVDMREATDELVEQASKAFSAYERWKRRVQFEPYFSELRVVSEEYRYGGTIDVAVVDGERALIDIKTSKSIYDEMWCQLAAYGQLYKEYFGESPEAYYILHITKQGDFNDCFRRPDSAVITNGWEVFKRLREVHDLGKKMKV